MELTTKNIKIGLRVKSTKQLKPHIPSCEYGVVLQFPKISSASAALRHFPIKVAWIVGTRTLMIEDYGIRWNMPDGDSVAAFTICEEQEDPSAEHEVDLSKKKKHEIWNSALEKVIDLGTDLIADDAVDNFINRLEELKKKI